MAQVVAQLLIIFYLALPLAAAGVAIWRARRTGRTGPVARFVVACVSGIAAGFAMLMLNSATYGGHVQTLEFFRATWLCIGAMCLLGWIGRGLLIVLFRVLRVKPSGPREHVTGIRAAIAVLLQRAVLLAVAIPYLVAVFIVYRPALQTSTHTPLSEWSMPYEDASFRSADGVPLSAWWIAPEMPDPSQTTVILVPGLGCGKDSLLGIGGKKDDPGLIPLLVSSGYSVLALDPRACGQSGGWFAGLGSTERRDVAAAVRYIRQTSPEQSHRIIVLGVNSGAVAALGACGEPGGEAIDGLVLIEPFSDIKSVLATQASAVFPRPVSWLIKHFTPPIASVHAGANLAKLSGAQLADRAWPRAVLVIHGRDQSFATVRQSLDVFRHCPVNAQEFFAADNYDGRRRALRADPQAGQFKSEVRSILRDLAGTNADSVQNDAGVQQRILRFIRTATPTPVI